MQSLPWGRLGTELHDLFFLGSLLPSGRSLRRESIKNTNSASAIGVKSVRPTWFEDIVTFWEPAQPEPMHGLKLVIKEEALPLKEQPEFPALAELAKRGLLAPDAWSCKRAQISLKATIDVPMLGTIIEQNGDGLLEQSHMPVGWPGHIDGAVRQSCAHRDTTLQELDNLLPEERLGRNQPQSTPMVSQHSVEQTIYGAKARFRLTTTVGELRVSYHTENIPLL